MAMFRYHKGKNKFIPLNGRTYYSAGQLKQLYQHLDHGDVVKGTLFNPPGPSNVKQRNALVMIDTKSLKPKPKRS